MAKDPATRSGRLTDVGKLRDIPLSRMAKDPDSIRQSYTVRVEEIRGRKDLSDDGRRRQLAKVYAKANATMRQAREELVAQRASREQQLLRTLFGNPNSHDATSVVSFRDAQDRAEALKTPTEARELLARARRSGDRLLVRAVAMRALDQAIATPTRNNEWGDVVDNWAADEGAFVDDALTELSDLHSASTDSWADALQHSLGKPAELSDERNVDALARDADQNPGEDEPPLHAGNEFFSRR